MNTMSHHKLTYPVKFFTLNSPNSVVPLKITKDRGIMLEHTSVCCLSLPFILLQTFWLHKNNKTNYGFLERLHAKVSGSKLSTLKMLVI